MSKKYLIALKSPPTSFMVDGITGKFPRIKSMDFMQEGKTLYIPVDINSNISYIQEMTDEDIRECSLRLEEMKQKMADMRAKVIKVRPEYKGFGKKTN